MQAKRLQLFRKESVSRIITPRKKLAYTDRKYIGDSLEVLAAKFFQNLGINVAFSGQGYIPTTVSRNIIQLSDPTSSLVRFWPDIIIPIPSSNLTILADCKNTKGNTSNYSFCLDSFEFHEQLAETLKVLILYIFPALYQGDGLRGIFVHELRPLIRQEFSKPEKLKRVYGSKRPFAIVSKRRIPRLDYIMRDISFRGMVA